MNTCGVKQGFLVGVPQYVSGCDDPKQSIAACTQPLNTLYSFTNTDTGYIIGVSSAIANQINNVDWTYTLVEDGWYAATYKGKEVKGYLTESGGYLSTEGTATVQLSQKRTSEDEAPPMLVRVIGDFIATNDNGVMTFSQGTNTVIATYVLGGKLVSYNGDETIVPMVLNLDVLNTPNPGLPGGSVLVNYIPGNVKGSTPTIFAMPINCDQPSDPIGDIAKRNQNDANSSMWFWVISGIILLIILVIVGFFIAKTFKKESTTSYDAYLPYLLLTK